MFQATLLKAELTAEMGKQLTQGIHLWSNSIKQLAALIADLWQTQAYEASCFQRLIWCLTQIDRKKDFV